MNVILTQDQLSERLAKMLVSSEDSQAILDYAQRLINITRATSRKLDHAAKLIGYQTLNETMIEDLYDH